MKSKETVKKRIVNIDYEKNKISWIYYMPLLLIAGFVPLIVYGKYVDLTGTTQALYWTGQNQLLDFFSYWKSRWVIFLTVASTFTYIFLFISKKLPFKKEYKYYIPLAIYAIFVILSTIFAIDVPTALNGFVDMYQSMWVLLSYATITFLIINFVNSERDVKLFLYAFIFLVIVEGVIGVGQYFGFDIFNTKFGNNLIIPSGVQVDGGLTFNFGKHAIYGTLFNTNFVGSFATLMMPMSLAFLVTVNGWKKRVIAGIASILCVFIWIGCNSRAGYVGVIFSGLVFSLLFRKYLIKQWRIGVGICLVGIFAIIGFNFISEGKIERIVSNTYNDFVKILFTNTDSRKLEEIYINNNNFVLETSYETLSVVLENNELYFYDENNNLLSFTLDENHKIHINDNRYVYYNINLYEPFMEIAVESMNLNKFILFFDEESNINLIGGGNRITVPKIADKVELLDKMGTLMSGRAYIWSRTIPLLEKYLLVGSGADNYIFAFPHDDIIGMYNSGFSANEIIDKPHNMYMQIAINTGVVSLLFLIILWCTYVFSSIKIFWRLKFDCFDEVLGLACLISIIGYLFSGIFNDHVISVAPLFWIILGLGISINIRLKRKEKKDV